jgi:putative endopeptidase
MKTMSRALLGVALLAIAPAALAGEGAPKGAATTSAKPRMGTWGFDTAGMNTAVKPGDDFFRFANGGWLDRAVIPADRPVAGGWLDLEIGAENDTRAIVEALANDPKAGASGKQIGDLYASWMDEAGIEARGAAPLKPYLARVDAVKTRDDLVRLFAEPGYYSPASIFIEPDPSHPTQLVAWVGQPGLGLPGRDYYLLKGEKYDTVRTAYRAYVEQIQRLAGIPDAAAKADRIIALETRMATDNWAPERSRDIQQTYHPLTPAQLTQLAPQYNWPLLLRQSGLGSVPTLIAQEDTAIKAAGQRLDDVPLQTWKDYVAYRFVSDHASYLPRAFDQANFAMFSQTLYGQKQQRDRWKRGTSQLNSMLGESVGQLYVARRYPPESERQMSELIENLRASYGDLMSHATWMDDATRTQAKAKLAAFEPRIGHPVRYIDYSNLAVRRHDLLGNAVRSEDFQWKLRLSRLPKPVDRTLWDMTPQTVNAYYDPLRNQITFPAAILQPPFFDPAADPAVDYGAIGAVIGHEMGHGFDDQGRQYDATGHLRDWWSKEAADKYTAGTKRLVAQYNAYEPIPGLHVNGQLTLGENLGDLGGVQAAYGAYRRYVAQHGEPPVIGGFTGDQRFFLAYAQVWREKWSEELQRSVMLTDPHSPDENRTNGVLRNFDPWYKAFNIKPGDKLYLPPEERVHVW